MRISFRYKPNSYLQELEGLILHLSEGFLFAAILTVAATCSFFVRLLCRRSSQAGRRLLFDTENKEI